MNKYWTSGADEAFCLSVPKLVPDGRVTGIYIWSSVDMDGNSLSATQRNIDLEAITSRCALVSAWAQQMPFAQAVYDVIVSNLCLHNIYYESTRRQALAEIVRILKPGGQALLSDYKRTSEYAAQLRAAGFEVYKSRGSLWATFPRSLSSLRVNRLPDTSLFSAHPRRRRKRTFNEMADNSVANESNPELIKQLLALLRGGQAHVGFDAAVKDFPVELRGTVPESLPYSAWRLLEHLRIAQRDILNFSAPPTGGYQHMAWPDAYWPMSAEPPSATAWEESIAAIHADRKLFEALLTKPGVDLYKPFRWGEGQNLLREALLIADHNAYHVGELILLRRLLGAWHK